MIDEIEFINDTTKYSMENLASLCILALEDVVFHFFHHFKASASKSCIRILSEGS